MMTIWHSISSFQSPNWALRWNDWIVGTIRRNLLAPGQRGALFQSLVAILIGSLLAVAITMIAGAGGKRTYIGLIVLLAPFIAVMLGRLRLLMLMIIPVELAFQLDSYLDHQAEPEALGALGGMIVSVSLIFLVMLYALWFTELLSKRGPLANRIPHISLAHFIYPVVSSLSITVAYNTKLASFEVFLIWQSFLLYTYIASTIQTKHEIILLLTMTLFTMALEGFVMLLARASGSTMHLGPFDVRVDEPDLRVGGTIGSPNGAASYFALMLIPALCSLLKLPGWKYKTLAGSALLFGFIGLLLTQSRGGLIAFGMGSAIFFLLGSLRGWVSLRIPIITMGFVILVSLMFPHIIFARFLEDDGGSLDSRAPLEQLANRVIDDHPLLGVGANNFAIVMPEYITPEFGDDWLFIVHNKYLLVWAETGILGLIAFVIFLLTMLYQGFMCWRTNDIDPFIGMLCISFGAGMIGLMFQMQYDVFNGRSLVQILWFASGFTTALSHMRHRPEIADEPIPDITKLLREDMTGHGQRD